MFVFKRTHEKNPRALSLQSDLHVFMQARVMLKGLKEEEIG
jgi:hypothetical protein